MEYIVKTRSRETKFYDKTEAENYYNALNSIGVGAVLVQVDLFNNVMCLGVSYA